jgi:hypothetical protein
MREGKEKGQNDGGQDRKERTIWSYTLRIYIHKIKMETGKARDISKQISNK